MNSNQFMRKVVEYRQGYGRVEQNASPGQEVRIFFRGTFWSAFCEQVLNPDQPVFVLGRWDGTNTLVVKPALVEEFCGASH